MTRTEEFEQKIDALLEEFIDLYYEYIADSFEYYAAEYINKANREG